METFEWVIALLLAAVALAALARRMGAPYPTFLAVGGVALAFVPHAPGWTLEPDLALAVFVAPILLDAAYDTSVRDMKDNWLPIASLVIVAVSVTTLGVAFVARWLVPDMPWPVAIALGAIVAPPDAGAATSVLRQAGLPHRILKILEGESLLNDASALLIYRLAIGAVLAGGFSLGDVAPTFLVGVAGSLIAGPALAFVWQRFFPVLHDAPSAIIVQFAMTFAIWIAAERVGLSGILTVVSYGIAIARRAPIRTPARLRVPSYAVWETAVFVLNAFAFMLIGMQLAPIWQRLSPALRDEYVVFALTVLATVILVRLAWVMLYNTLNRIKIAYRGFGPIRPLMRPTARGGLIISWSGMRGIVTLAAAFAIPETLPGGAAFPYRDLILLTAFAVVLGTLVIQGLTLRPLILAFGLDDGNPIGVEIGRARAAAYRAALLAIDGDETIEAKLLRKEYARLVQSAQEDPKGQAPSQLPADPLRRRAIEAARLHAHELRLSGDIGDDAYHILEEEFDWAELSAQNSHA